MAYSRILIVSDNQQLAEFFASLLERRRELSDNRTFRFICGPNNHTLAGKTLSTAKVEAFDIKQHYKEIIGQHDLVISAHCKQLFPKQLVENCKCINVHPGLNPFNRGWYPQVFSILNGLPLGATIHEIDSKIDHGAIIAQQEVPVYAWDTSLDAYNRVLDAEKQLIEESIVDILNDTYKTSRPAEEGNLNLKKDFDELREIKLQDKVSFAQAIDRLRALSHPPYKNTYFIDPKSGKRVWITIMLDPETETETKDD